MASNEEGGIHKRTIKRRTNDLQPREGTELPVNSFSDVNDQNWSFASSWNDQKASQRRQAGMMTNLISWLLPTQDLQPRLRPDGWGISGSWRGKSISEEIGNDSAAYLKKMLSFNKVHSFEIITEKDFVDMLTLNIQYLSLRF